MRHIILASLGAAALALGGCDEMKAGFDKGYADGKARAEAEREKKKAAAAGTETPAQAEAAAPEKAPAPAT